MADSSILANFPTAVLTPIASLTLPPTYLSLETAQRELNANAASVHSYGGGGRHGHLALTISPAAYLALATVPFVPPVVPALTPVLGDAPTAAQITEANRLHLAAQKTFQRYHDVDKALLRQLIAAVPPVYIAALNDRTIGFSNVSCLQLLTHLKDRFGRISLAEMDANTARMSTAWHPPTPIDALFEQLNQGVYFASAGQEPLVDSHIARLGYNLVLQTGLFPDACRDWRLKPSADRTYAAFQTHFRRMDMDRQEAATSGSAGFHGAANLAAAADNQPAPLSEHALLLTELAALRAQLAAAIIAPPPAAPRMSTRRAHHPARSYCWTHGSSDNISHTSLTCRNKANGHRDEATFRNKLGGSTHNRGVPPTGTTTSLPVV
jgi:hypothetical protein